MADVAWLERDAASFGVVLLHALVVCIGAERDAGEAEDLVADLEAPYLGAHLGDFSGEHLADDVVPRPSDADQHAHRDEEPQWDL